MSNIQAECRRRRIKALYHFTNAKNLPAIFDEDGLLSREQIAAKNLIDVVFGDRNRMDQHLDRISLSISHPNTAVLWAQRQNNNGDRVIIRLSPDVLWKLDCLFFCHNAATKNIEPLPFEDLFDGTRNKHPISEQAEVMVKDRIPSCFFRKEFIVYSAEVRERMNKHIQLRDFGFSLQADRHLFLPRR